MAYPDDQSGTPPAQQQATPPPAPSGGGGFDWGGLLAQLLPAHLISGLLRAVVPGAGTVFDEASNVESMRSDQARLLHTYLATNAPYLSTIMSGANPDNGGVGWGSNHPFSIFPTAPGGPGPNLPQDVQQNLGFQMAPGVNRDAYMKGLQGFHAPGAIPQNVPLPTMTEPLARSWLLQTQAQQGGFAPFPGMGPGGTPGGIPMSGWTWDPKTGWHLTGQTERIPEQPQPAPFPDNAGKPGAQGRGIGKQPQPDRRLSTSPDSGTYIPPFNDGKVVFPGGSIGPDGVQVTGGDGSKWSRNPDNSLTPVSPAPAPASGAPTGAPGAPGTAAATPPAPGQPPAQGAAPAAPGAAPGAPTTPPAPADMDAARQRLQDKYGKPPGQTGQPSPAFTPPGEAAGTQVGMSLAPPPGTAPGAEPPSLPGRILGALGPSVASAAEPGFMPPPTPPTPPAKPTAPGTTPTPPSTGGTIPTEAKDPGQTFNRISDATVGVPGFADDLKRRYSQVYGHPVTDINQIKPTDLVNDKYAVAIGNMYARQLKDDEILNRGKMTQQARAQADRERVQDMYNVIHTHYTQVLGYLKDPKTGEQRPVTAMDASSPSYLWSELTPEHAAQPGMIRTLLEKASPRGSLPPYGANYLKQNDSGPAGAAAGRMLASDALAISVARAFGTSGRINQTELNIIMNKILPNANNTYDGNVNALNSLEANMKALASGASVADMRSQVGLPPLNAQGEAE